MELEEDPETDREDDLEVEGEEVAEPDSGCIPRQRGMRRPAPVVARDDQSTGSENGESDSEAS